MENFEAEVQKELEEVKKNLYNDKTVAQLAEEVDVKKIQHLYSECFNLPKIELHAHIGGCIRPERFLSLAEAKGISVEHIDFYNVDMKMSFEIFQVVSKIVTNMDVMEEIIHDIIQDYAKHNCAYLELRSTPKAFEGSSLQEYFERTIKAIKEGEEDQNGRIRVRYVASISRHLSVEVAKTTVDLAIKFKEEGEKYLVGLEVSGDPRVGDFNAFIEQLQRAKDAGLKISVHTGEVEEQMRESKAIIEFKPDRLGHCIYLTQEEMQQVIDYNIPVEICPTSNAQTTKIGVVGLLKHLNWFHSMNHNIIICCDDTMLFGTNISNELFEFAQAVGADSKQLKELLLKNVDAIFDDDSKDWLRTLIRKFNC